MRCVGTVCWAVSLPWRRRFWWSWLMHLTSGGDWVVVRRPGEADGSHVNTS